MSKMLTCNPASDNLQDSQWQYQQLSGRGGLFDTGMLYSPEGTDDNILDPRLSEMFLPLLDAGGGPEIGLLETGACFTNPPPYLPTQHETCFPQTATSEQVEDHDATRAAVVERLSMLPPDTIPGCAQSIPVPRPRTYNTLQREILEAQFSFTKDPDPVIGELVNKTGLTSSQIRVGSNQTRRDSLSI